MVFSARVKYTFLIVLFTLGTINFVRTALRVMENSKRMNDLSTVVKTLEIEKDTLSRDLEYKKSEDFVEKMARTELTLVKPGEEIYVVEGDFTQNVSNSGVKAALGAFTERLSATNSPNHFNEWFSLFL